MISHRSILAAAAAVVLVFAVSLPARAAQPELPVSEILRTVVVGNTTIIFATAKLGDAEVSRLRTWDEFAGKHTQLARQLGNSPSLLTDGSFLKQEPEFAGFLSAHRELRKAMLENPGNFVVAAH
jgi:hypothetical protein